MLDADYKQLLKSMQLEPKTYKCMADDWNVKQEEWYHALISIEVLPIIQAIPDLEYKLGIPGYFQNILIFRKEKIGIGSIFMTENM